MPWAVSVQPPTAGNGSCFDTMYGGSVGRGPGATKKSLFVVATSLSLHQNPLGRVLHVSLIWFAQPDLIFEQPIPKGWAVQFCTGPILACQIQRDRNRLARPLIHSVLADLPFVNYRNGEAFCGSSRN